MWSRRKFLGDTLYLSGGVTLASSFIDVLGRKDKSKSLTILHTNDTHSHIDPFPENDSKYPGQGGVSRRASVINKIRAEEENVLLLDAGDIFQGTPYFNRYGGVLEMKLMTELGYDASTMGNHDFDGGLDGFLKAKQYAKFPFLCANYEFFNTILSGQTIENTTFKKGGIKIGVFGLGVELNGLVPKSKFEDTVYLDPIAIAQTQIKELQKENCDLIICLSHLGYDYEDKKRVSDLNLASNTDGIHLIIGGHTHTFLPEPTVAKNRLGENVLINQVGWAGLQLGRIDFTFENGLKNKSELIRV
jgi:5'-nucleotidase|tara:strand:+ start:14414 stop:15322 length:909 start_codon:yes stop_codon:yes gene_type:complete